MVGGGKGASFPTASPLPAASVSLRERLWFVPWRGPKNSQISKPGKPTAQKIVHPDSMFFRLTEAFINEVTTPIFTVCGARHNMGHGWECRGDSRPAPAGLAQEDGKRALILQVAVKVQVKVGAGTTLSQHWHPFLPAQDGVQKLSPAGSTTTHHERRQLSRAEGKRGAGKGKGICWNSQGLGVKILTPNC